MALDKQEALERIQTHREEIDRIDRMLVELLNERCVRSQEIRVLKPYADMQLLDQKREDSILARIAERNNGPLSNENLHEIYRTMLKAMKESPLSDDIKDPRE